MEFVNEFLQTVDNGVTYAKKQFNTYVAKPVENEIAYAKKQFNTYVAEPVENEMAYAEKQLNTYVVEPVENEINYLKDKASKVINQNPGDVLYNLSGQDDSRLVSDKNGTLYMGVVAEIFLYLQRV